MSRFILSLIVALLITSTARAQSDGEQTLARAAFSEGERAFQAGDYPAALAAFERAFALVPHDAVRFNIAVCLERLGRFVEAREQYDAAAESTTLSARERERAELSAAAARKRLARLVAESGPPGRAVNVDGVERCATPCRLELDPGRYRVKIGKGTNTQVISLTLRSGKSTAIAAPEPAPRSRTQPRRTSAPSPERESRGPGALTWAGGGLAIAGSAATVYFGIRTEQIKDDYVAEPTQDRYDSGRTSRLITNVSLGVAAVGAAMLLVDLLILAPQPRERARAVGPLLTF